jgi:hypothetical protein
MVIAADHSSTQSTTIANFSTDVRSIFFQISFRLSNKTMNQRPHLANTTGSAHFWFWQKKWEILVRKVMKMKSKVPLIQRISIMISMEILDLESL